MPGLRHEPTEKSRKQVRRHAAVGTPQRTIADCLGIHVKTLREHYRAELDLSLADANAEVVGQLYQQAMSGNIAAITFWLKTRAGFRETKVVDNQSTDGSMSPKTPSFDVSKLSTAALQEVLALAAENQTEEEFDEALARAAGDVDLDDAPTTH